MIINNRVFLLVESGRWRSLDGHVEARHDPTTSKWSGEWHAWVRGDRVSWDGAASWSSLRDAAAAGTQFHNSQDGSGVVESEMWSLVKPYVPPGLGTATLPLLSHFAAAAQTQSPATDTAKAIGMARRTCSNWLRSQGLPTPREILAWMRLLRAAHLLDTTDLKVADVSARAGFAHGNALRTALAAYVGLTPRRLRRDGAMRLVGTQFRTRLSARCTSLMQPAPTDGPARKIAPE